MSQNNTSKRLASLDILRGLDLFLLLFLQPVVVAIGQAAHSPRLDSLLWHLDHEVWEGFRAWDLVMPLFLFMVGTSMPFSFSKYRNSPGHRDIYRKIARRFLLLFVFGMIVQGNLLGFDPDHIYIYTNTLQAIAFGYLIAAILLINLSMRWQIAATVLLLAVYWIPMKFCGDYTLGGNFASAVDRVIIGRFRGDPTYSWVWSSLTFGATVMLGAFAGTMMRGAATLPEKQRVAAWMTLTGVALTAAGLLWSLEMPIIKRLWTSSMTLFSGGICFMLMALFYYVIDCCGYSRGLNWLKVYGMNPITAYVIGEVISFRSVVASVSYGLAPWLGDYYQAWLTFGNFLILYAILWLMYRNKIFLKI